MGSPSKVNHHHLINVINHGPQSCSDWFDSLNSLKLTDISALPLEDKVSAVRDLDLDLAIDLSIGPLAIFWWFSAKLAPVQCST